MPTRSTTRTNGALRPVRRQNVSQAVADALAEEIERGRLKPGERLRSERELSEVFEISRSSVREAIKTLQSRGLVEGRQGEGTFVCRQGLDALVSRLTGPVSVNEVEIGHLFEVRRMLEPEIARLAAERARPADIAALHRLMERQERLVESGSYTSDDDARFHQRLVEISGNPVLIRLLNGVMRLLGAVREPALRAASIAGLRITLAGHWDILRAVEARDANAAAAAALKHLDGAHQTAVKVLREVESQGDR